MRVKLKQDVRLYWNYAIQTLEKGTEHIGDLAQHLWDNAVEGAVEILDGKPAKPAGPAEPDAKDPVTDPDVGDTAPADDAGEPPVDGTIDDLMTWVGDDKARATQALAAEQAKDKPRSTVVKRLTALADADDK
jgi:hypothetical protein